MYVILNKDNNMYLGKNTFGGDIQVNSIEKAFVYKTQNECSHSIRLLYQCTDYNNLKIVKK